DLDQFISPAFGLLVSGCVHAGKRRTVLAPREFAVGQSLLLRTLPAPDGGPSSPTAEVAVERQASGHLRVKRPLLVAQQERGLPAEHPRQACLEPEVRTEGWRL